MSLHLKTKFCIAKPWSNIQSFRRFHFDLWQTSKQIYRKLQYRNKVFEDIQGLTRFPRKMVLYSSTTLGIIKPSTNIPWLRWFDLGFSQTSKQIFRKLQLREEIFGELQTCSTFPEKPFCISWPNLPLKTIEPIFNNTEDSIYAFDSLQRKFIEIPKKLECFCRVSRFALLFQKMLL